MIYFKKFIIFFEMNTNQFLYENKVVPTKHFTYSKTTLFIKYSNIQSVICYFIFKKLLFNYTNSIIANSAESPLLTSVLIILV